MWGRMQALWKCHCLPWQHANGSDLGSLWCAKDGLPSCTSYKVGKLFLGWEGFQGGAHDMTVGLEFFSIDVVDFFGKSYCQGMLEVEIL